MKMDNWYIEWDEEYQWYGIFNSETGFCKASFSSLDEAKKYLSESF